MVHRRTFLQAAMSAAVLQAGASSSSLSHGRLGIWDLPFAATGEAQSQLKPMAVGLMIQPARDPEAAIARVKELGLTNCFLSLDGYIGKLLPQQNLWADSGSGSRPSV